MANTIGTVTKIQNEVFAKSADGQLRRLALGDKILEGDVVVTAVGSSVEITPISGDAVQVAEQSTASMTNDVFNVVDGALAKGSVGSLKETTAPTILDLNQLLEEEAAAAGLTGGDADGGHSFVSLLRIVENVDPNSYNFPIYDRAGPELPGTGGDIPAPAADDAVLAPPVVSIWNDSYHNGTFEFGEDNQNAYFYREYIDGDNDPGTDKIFIGDLLREGKAITTTQINNNPPATTVLEYTSDITFTFLSEGAGYQNAVGWYDVNNPDVGHVVWENASARNSGGSLRNGDTVTFSDIPAGTQIGFFLIPDSYNQEGAIPDTVYFRNGHAYKNSDFTNRIDGNDNMTGDSDPVWFSNSTNSDALQHVITGVSSDLSESNVLYVGFEDLGNGGDKDYNDVVFKVNLGEGNDVFTPAIEFDVGVTIADSDSANMSKAVLSFVLEENDVIKFDLAEAKDSGLTVSRIDNTFTIEGNASVLDYNDLLDTFHLVIKGLEEVEGPVTESRSATIQVWDETNQASNIDSATFNIVIQQPSFNQYNGEV